MVEQAGSDPDRVAQVVATHPAHRTQIMSRLQRSFDNSFVQSVMAKVQDLGEHLKVVGGEAVGVAELAGFRYPVKAYEAQVDGGLYRGSRLLARSRRDVAAVT